LPARVHLSRTRSLATPLPRFAILSVSRRTLLKIAIPLVLLLLCLLLMEAAARLVLGRPTMILGIEMWKYAKDVKLVHPNPEIGTGTGRMRTTS